MRWEGTKKSVRKQKSNDYDTNRLAKTKTKQQPVCVQPTFRLVKKCN